MKDKKKTEQEIKDAERREFIKKSARDIGACGYALFELAKTIREEIIQSAIEDIKEAIKRS